MCVACDRLRNRDHERHVRVARLGERRWDGDRDRIHLGQSRFVRARGKFPRFDQGGDLGARNILNVRLAAVDQIHDALAHVVADDTKASLREFDREREADVSKPDDADDGRSVSDTA
jgi:hypothetical protein